MTAEVKAEVIDATFVEKLTCASCGRKNLTEESAYRVPLMQKILCLSCAGLGTRIAVGALELVKTGLKQRRGG